MFENITLTSGGHCTPFKNLVLFCSSKHDFFKKFQCCISKLQNDDVYHNLYQSKQLRIVLIASSITNILLVLPRHSFETVCATSPHVYQVTAMLNMLNISWDFSLV